jgi:hypothetical protein
MSKSLRKQSRSAPRARINPLIKKWLAGLEEDGGDDDGTDWDTWLTNLREGRRITNVGGILVDHAVLEQRFACVPERCSPALRHGNSRCCCTDLEVDLSKLERTQLEKNAQHLSRHLARREPRLELSGRARDGFFWSEEESTLLRRPEGRCIFSQLDPKGRVRCHMHGLAQRLGIDKSEIQPLTCRVFPFVIVAMDSDKLVLSVLAPHTYKEVGSLHPRRFPCLGDRSLPPIYESMGADLDWMFGEGFAARIAALAAKVGSGRASSARR